MQGKAAVGWSTDNHSFEAGVEAATRAMDASGGGRADFVFLFSAARHDQDAVLRGVRSVTGDVPLLGGSTYGIIAEGCIGYQGYEVGVAVIRSRAITFQTFAQPGLNQGEYDAGRSLGRQIQNARDDSADAMLLFYDSVKSSAPPALNWATLLIDGLASALTPMPMAAGGGILEDDFLTRSFQFHDDRVVTQHACALLLGGSGALDVGIVHGCRPSSAYHTITRAEGPFVYEIDGIPALDRIDELLGPASTLERKDFPLFITLGVNNGEKWGPFREQDYANRLTLAVDQEQRALIMFEPDLATGQEVQLMRRSIDQQYITDAVADIERRLDGKNPLLCLYINCAGRRKAFAGGTVEEAQSVVDAFAGRIPLLGFYSGVEIAPVGGLLRPLDWTGVLAVISEA